MSVISSLASSLNPFDSQTTQATPAAPTPTSGTGSAAASSSQSALQSLAGNFNDFLTLLMTQLQNQDPASPMDTSTFTTQLVQFAGVGQQITANANLTQLIQLTQGNEILQSSSMVGKSVTVQSDHIALQNGTGQLQFTAPGAEPAAIGIYNDAGLKIRDALVTAAPGTNGWTWDGTDNSGNSVPDGSYRVAVVGANPDGSTSALPFNIIGTATGVQKSADGSALQLQLGKLNVDFSAVQSLGN